MVVNYRGKKFYNSGPCVLYYKSVMIIIYDCNAWSSLGVQNRFCRLLEQPKILNQGENVRKNTHQFILLNNVQPLQPWAYKEEVKSQSYKPFWGILTHSLMLDCFIIAHIFCPSPKMVQLRKSIYRIGSRFCIP